MPEPSKFEPINFKRAKALTRSGSLPKFDFPSLMDTPELLPVTPRLVHSSDTHLADEVIILCIVYNSRSVKNLNNVQ